MSIQTQEQLDERAALGPKVHIACCEIHKPITFCGIEPDPAKATVKPEGHGSTCAPCVEKDEESKTFCPRHGTCPRGGRR